MGAEVDQDTEDYIFDQMNAIILSEKELEYSDQERYDMIQRVIDRLEL